MSGVARPALPRRPAFGTALRALGAWLSDAPSTRFRIALLSLYALHLALGLAHHAMWRDELQAWLIVRDSTSLADLVHHLGYEGHPLGWYLLLWPLRALGPDPVLIQFVQGATALLVAALLLWRGPFSRLELILLLLSYPLFFEYALKSRSYALGTLILFAFAAGFAIRRPFTWLAALLALLMNIHVLFGLVALGGLAAIALQRISGEGWRGLMRRSDVPGLALLVIGTLAAAFVAHPPPDSGFATAWSFDLAPDHLLRTALGLGGLVTDTGSDLLPRDIGMALGLGIAAIILLRGRRAPPAALFFAVASAALAAFLHVKYDGGPWHHALFFVVLVAAMWMARGSSGPSGPALLPPLLFTIILGLQAAAGIAAAIADRRIDYSSARATAAALKEAGVDPASIVAIKDFSAVSVVAYLEAPSIFYGPGMRPGSFVVWDQARRVPITIGNMVDHAAGLANPVILSCDDRPKLGPPPDPRLVEWRGFAGRVESCTLYRLQGH